MFDRCIDYETNELQFGSVSKAKLSLRSCSFQFENKLNYSSLSEHNEKPISESGSIRPNLNCMTTFSIDSVPKEIPLSAMSIKSN